MLIPFDEKAKILLDDSETKRSRFIAAAFAALHRPSLPVGIEESRPIRISSRPAISYSHLPGNPVFFAFRTSLDSGPNQPLIC